MKEGISIKDFRIGVKIYSLDWYWKYNLDYKQAANELKSMGVNYIITQSKYIPMSNSAVESQIPREKRTLMDRYSDKEFRKVLLDEGIEYYGACNFFFDPDLMNKHNNIPIDHLGQAAQKIDWYIGGCPTCESYVDERIATIENAMKELNMDGVFLGFMRYPGFWELWLPETNPKLWGEYCFCPRCIRQFKEAKNVDIPDNLGVTTGEWIRKNAYDKWGDFKSDVIFNIVKRVRNKIRKTNSNAKIILNTVPFDEKHYGQYGKIMFAQDPGKLAAVVDTFEVMGYHQILKRPYSWIAEAGKYFKQKTNKDVVCTVQAKPLYLDDIYGDKGRSKKITPHEFSLALNSIKDAGLDGVALFTWADFLKQKIVDNDATFVDIIRSLT